jgi:hypothetical protein
MIVLSVLGDGGVGFKLRCKFSEFSPEMKESELLWGVD